MIELNLTATNRQEELVKDYLKNNVSETLAEKINNGVKIVKDDKTLINKKTLSGFMKYACVEARKQAEKGANSACVEDATVFGWAIHYFEEDSIEEQLLNEDGSEYKPTPKYTPPPKVEVKPVIKKENEQASLFEFLTNETKEEKQEQIKEEIPDYYKKYLEIEKQYPNTVVITRLGDFFEMYGKNASELANYLNLNMIKKDIGNEKIEMIGFPASALISEKYIAKIREKRPLTIFENDVASSFPQSHVEKDNLLIDTSTGEVIENTNQTFDKYILETISNLFDNKLKLE